MSGTDEILISSTAIGFDKNLDIHRENIIITGYMYDNASIKELGKDRSKAIILIISTKRLIQIPETPGAYLPLVITFPLVALRNFLVAGF